jgi:lipid-binding SYLF domain-containing protein
MARPDGEPCGLTGGELSPSYPSDVLLQAELLTYTRSRGLFAGANFKGAVVRSEDDLNMAVYDKTARELLSDQANGDAGADARLKAFRQAIGRYTVNPSSDR